MGAVANAEGHGWAALVDTNGSTIWHHLYRNCDSSTFNYLTDGVYDSVLNEYILTGVGQDCSKSNFLTSTWFLRLDSDGCAVQNCTPLSNNNFNKQNIFASVYPNPSNGSFEIDFGKPINKVLPIIIYNTYGQIVYHQSKYIADKAKISLDVSNGVYYTFIDKMVVRIVVTN
jgi:hypothetical protein